MSHPSPSLVPWCVSTSGYAPGSGPGGPGDGLSVGVLVLWCGPRQPVGKSSPIRSARIHRRVLQAGLYLVLIALGILIRASTGPWYHLYNPADARVLDDVPVTWEVVYFAPHVASFTSSKPPPYGFAPVQTRALVPLAIAAVFTTLTNHVGIALLLVEAAGWFLASIATARLGAYLGVSPTAAFLGGFLVATAPIFSSQLGMLVLHLAEFASLPLGLIAVAPLLNSEPNVHRFGYWPIRQGIRLGIVLTILSLSYVYHWAIFTVLFLNIIVRMVTDGRRAGLAEMGERLSHALITLTIGFGLFILNTAAITQSLEAVGLPPLAGERTAVAQPLELIVQTIGSRDLSGLVEWAIEFSPRALLITTAFHTLPLLAGIVGIIVGPGLRVPGVALLAFGMVSSCLYPAPWTSMTAFPIVYLGAGHIACVTGHIMATKFCNQIKKDTTALLEALSLGIATTIVATLAIATNLDLFGDPAFALSWWQAYWPVLPY